MDKKPTVYVLMGAYNAEKYISKALNSLIDQTYHRWQLSLIENGSTDGTRAIIEKISKREPRIKVINLEYNTVIHPGKSQRPSNMERISDADESDYYATLDADDYFYSEQALEQMVNAATQHDADIVITGCTMFYDNQNRHGYRLPPDGVYKNVSEIGEVFAEIYGSIRPVWSKLFRVQIVRKFAQDEVMNTMGNGSDTMWNLLALEHAKSAVSLAVPTICHRMYEASVYFSNIYPTRYKSYNYIYDKTKELLIGWDALTPANYDFIERVRFFSMDDIALYASKASDIDAGLDLIYNILTDTSFNEGLRSIDSLHEFECLVEYYVRENMSDRLTIGILRTWAEKTDRDSAEFTKLISVLYDCIGITEHILLKDLSKKLIFALHETVAPVLEDNYEQALEVFIDGSEGFDIDAEDVESYLLFAQNLSALAESGDAFVYYNKLWAQFLLDSSRLDEASEVIAEFLQDLPDDDDFIQLQMRLVSLNGGEL